MDNEDNECLICGEELKTCYSLQFNCTHQYHYECIYKYLVNTHKKSLYNYTTKNRCPYCNQDIGLLPIVNGLKEPKKYIHFTKDIPCDVYVNQKCKHLLKSGKRKGGVCNKQCKLGYEYCGIHNKLAHQE
jgi:hypothetical protein